MYCAKISSSMCSVPKCIPCVLCQNIFFHVQCAKMSTTMSTVLKYLLPCLLCQNILFHVYCAKISTSISTVPKCITVPKYLLPCLLCQNIFYHVYCVKNINYHVYSPKYLLPLLGELIVYPWSGVRRRSSVVRPSSVVHNAQTSSSQKLLGRTKPNFMWSLLG